MRYLLRADRAARSFVVRFEKRNLFFKAVARVGSFFRWGWAHFVAFGAFRIATRATRLRNRCQYSFSGASPRRQYNVGRNVFRLWAGSGAFSAVQRSSW